LPDLVRTEREAVLRAVRRERIESLEFLRQERLETLARLTDERVAVFEGADEMRAAVNEAIHTDIRLIADLIREQRAQTMRELAELTGLTVGNSFERAETLVDQVFLRLLVALVLIFVGCVLLILLAWRLFRGRTAPETA
jgi:hypothetical protein